MPREYLTEALSALVAIPAYSGQEKNRADYVCDRLREAGLAPQRDGDDNVCVEVGPAKAGRLLHVNAHLDTVLPVAGWTGDPHRPRVEGDRLYGLGASDCGGGLAAMLWLAPRVRPEVRVLFSWTVCEEGVGHAKTNGTRAMARHGGDWAITAEPSCSEEGPLISLGTQGHARATVRFSGRAAHSSRPDLGRNAIYAAARFCLEVEKLDAGYPEIPILGEARARASAAATIISGGLLSNIIPDRCEVTVSRRLVPGETADTLHGELDRLLTGVDARWEVPACDVAACTDPGGPLLAAARRALHEVTGTERFTFQRGRTDAVIFAAAGMDTLTLGPGLKTQCHVADEHIDLRHATACTLVMERLINSLPGLRSDTSSFAAPPAANPLKGAAPGSE